MPVERKTSGGPGVTEVRLETAEGPISITRPDGKLATYSSPGQPGPADRRSGGATLSELLAEELRRLDEDNVYAAVAQRLSKSERA